MTEPLQECSECGIRKPLSEFNLVSHSRPYPRQICRECEKEQKRKWRAEHPPLPKNPVDKAYEVQEAMRRRRELKHEVIVAYGGKCECCGEAEELLLTIDHIFNDGKEHRESLTDDHRAASRATYAWLRDNGYPRDRYQLLCFSCNNAKALYGLCPHEYKRRKEGREPNHRLDGDKDPSLTYRD